MCGGRIHWQADRKTAERSLQPLSLRAGSRRLCGSLAAFFVSNLDKESQVPVEQSSAAVLYAGGPEFKPRHETGWLDRCLCDLFPIRLRCCCGSFHQHFLIRPFYPQSLQRAGSSVRIVVSVRVQIPAVGRMSSPKVQTCSGVHRATFL